MSLRDIQQAFSAAVYDGKPEALAQLTVGPRQATSLDGAAIYQNNTRERLRGVLAQTFPVCAELVGERCFDQLTLVHVNEHPCRTHDLDLYGEAFSETVEQVLQAQPVLCQSVPYLAEMAKVEWLAHRAYFAPNRASFNFEKFANLGEQELPKVRFALAPDAALAALNWPIDVLWTMHQPGNAVRAVPMVSGEQWLVIERPKYQAQVVEVDEPLFETLALIHEGCTFEALAEKVADVRSQLTQALQSGWITGFTI